ncbi:MAG: Plastocyanin [Candidatus Wolfebacteria bacterium GW2011_GWE1_48_7]|uniref:EfeO-type cupredoxin-like domain-containing protein n=1 Tax=Candidatus Wolfebacteria bacterium GW2011_GWB1_47_1 TaxID=1619007 RepID=A0A0G4AQU9_9BACT|nr:MAG: hypothetical protein UX70_C0001G0158 [Candidatus Wolfebacteria bacterium GW2011_GWB1_47_1]KKU36735.1 MAG: Plastocyanin [Candidatus Wolfebacteria bacterium GW2011_GWC2_46_275]KKU41968.1 MAG: Plastocyanin [Candidatus Wolfebacteria bacterium GW2011_GWB2_46_69]KKU54496.1 MAG: Plastocyanin [Candidatus Wolfebacteria bacterium GW2011_GWC1_47_103]KKU65816.1 MAG: Plastocyanin [Candidatus Wolfebacteria bacterium GW2011_GWD2_47_17]KKU73232.1 MAG: Plastocyanin [Candidatus Wolfebacteria bacterium G
MKEKNIFIIILVVALIGIGVVGYRTYVMDTVTEVAQNRDAGVLPPPPAPADTSAPVVVAPSAIITYGDNGFSPKPITVTAGTNIVFMNESGADMWPASAPHPTHTDYPELDAKKPIKPLNSYAFVITRVGTWKYHNHLNPTHFGSIIVTE